MNVKYVIAILISVVFLSQSIYAQYLNLDMDIMPVFVKKSDSLMSISNTYLRPDQVTSIISNDSFLSDYKFRLLENFDKSIYAPKDIYSKSLPAVGLVAMCSKPNILHESIVNAATTFAVSEDGICITNFHVLFAYSQYQTMNNLGEFIVRMGNGKYYILKKIIAISAQNDIAIIQLDTKGEKIPFLKFASTKPVIGDEIYLIGNPSGMAYYFSKGMVTNFHNEFIPLPSGNKIVRRDLMSISADFAVGASGSPILDNHGAIVGLVSSTHIIEQKMYNNSSLTQMVVKNTIPLTTLIQLIQKLNSSKN
jgi:serine protease Do